MSVPTNRKWLKAQQGLKNEPLEKWASKLITEPRSLNSVDFLGWVNFLGHRVLRTTTKKRMIRKLTKVQNLETINSYMGLLKHGNTYKIKKALDNI